MPRRDLPPLRALTAFEAAARLGSFRLAAGELGITRSAVSHQVKSLEQRLGVQLFRRDARRAELTQTGHTYYPAVREAFDMIEAQTRALKPPAADNELTVQVYVTVALKWLIPRLHDFERRFPDMKVRLSTSYFDWDFDEKNVDAGFILARNRSPEHYYRTLFRSMLTPVCSPALMQRSKCTEDRQKTSRNTSCSTSTRLKRTGISGLRPQVSRASSSPTGWPSTVTSWHRKRRSRAGALP